MNEDMYIRHKKEHEELKRKHDWISDAPWWRKVLIFIFKKLRFGNWLWISHEDTTCSIHCSCEEVLFINDSWITWCENCGKGYSTMFEIVQYPAWIKRK
jgi:hypothetical protein